MRYRAFLSYSHVDRRWARWLHRALESYRLPAQAVAESGKQAPTRLAPVFRDRDELPSSASLSDAVTKALRNSDNLILICSPAAAASRWVNEEIQTFRRLGKASHILCLIVAGEPGAGDDTECFPEALLNDDSIAGPASEPVAADARPQGDGRKNALLKIIAGMLGVGFDVLKKRELRRRHRRMLLITAGSAVIAAVTAILAITATIARQDAEYRRTQAEDLVDFMLGDLTDRLREIGRLDIYQSVSDGALEYFALQRDADVSDRTLEQRAKNLRQIGEIRMDQKDLDAALVAFNESLLITSRLAAKDPSNTEAQIGLAFSHFYVGHVNWLRGDIAQAQTKFDEQLAIVKQLAELEPQNPKWLVELGYAYTNLGRVLEATGALEAANEAYQDVMVANQRLVTFDPSNEEWRLELGFAHNNLGKLAIAQGMLDEADYHYRRDLEVKSGVSDRSPAHNVWRRYLGISQYFLGQLLLERAEFAESETQLLASYENFELLLSIDPSRSSWQWRHANVERALGRLYLLTGRADQGSALVTSSITTLSTLLHSDTDHTGWRRDLVRSLISAAYAARNLESGEMTLQYLDSAETNVATLVGQEPEVRDTQELVIRIDIATAELLATRNPDVVSIRSAQALVKLDEFFSGSVDPRILKLRAQALEMAGQENEAEVLRQKLISLGLDV